MRPAALAMMIGCAALGSCAWPAAGPEATPLSGAGTDAAESPGVHNLIEVSPGVYSGSMPEGDAGFRTLGALGVRTVISVDGARPDVERARARSMRTVHLPIEYAGIDRGDRMNLARALRDLPRPIYVHCHHGEHRGPAAAAVGLRLIGELTPHQALAFLEDAGTSPSYPGLWQCVRDATPVSVSELDAWDARLPETAEVGGFVRGMALLDRAYDRMARVRDAGWAPPASHPDLVPAALAGQIADVFEQLSEPEHAAAGMVAGLRAAGEQARVLERALQSGDTTSAATAWSLVAASCNDCHTRTRNQP